MDGWGVIGYLFIYFWVVYFLLHIIMICRTLCCENNKRQYPIMYDNYNTIIDINTYNQDEIINKEYKNIKRKHTYTDMVVNSIHLRE